MCLFTLGLLGVRGNKSMNGCTGFHQKLRYSNTGVWGSGKGWGKESETGQVLSICLKSKKFGNLCVTDGLWHFKKLWMAFLPSVQLFCEHFCSLV